MYGLLKTNRCQMNAEQRYQHRLHYCGTCKTMGRLYGQSTRMMLNHDAVFLGELLSVLTEEQPEHWAASYQSYNCLALPESETTMPLPLQYAATANLLLTQFKLADHAQDSGRKRWQWLLKLWRSPFRDAAQRLSQWGFDLAALESLHDEQAEREKALKTTQIVCSPYEALRYAAAPTVQATARFFEHGAALIRQPQLSATLRQLGAEFGLLIYVLDALEDYEADAQGCQFNAIRAGYQLTVDKLPANERQQVVQFLLAIQEEIIASIQALPLPAATAALFIERLRTNLSRKLAINLPVIACARRRISLRERWRRAVATGRQLTQQELHSCGALVQLKAPFIFALVFIVLLLAPTQSLKSWRDCLGLSVNLMFLGALPAAIWATMQSFAVTGEEKNKKSQEAKSSCADGCCDGCCEGCCDGCCNCSCDNCCGCDCSCDC